MRIDPTSTHRPTDTNKPAEKPATQPVAPSVNTKNEPSPRNHLVRERRRRNRAIDGEDRRRGQQKSPSVNHPYGDTPDPLKPTEGPARLVDIDC